MITFQQWAQLATQANQAGIEILVDITGIILDPHGLRDECTIAWSSLLKDSVDAFALVQKEILSLSENGPHQWQMHS